MDRTREKYITAQKHADRILMMKQGRFLETEAAADMRINRESFVPNITLWYRLRGYRRAAEQAVTDRSLRQAVSDWIRATTAYGCSAAFALRRSDGELSVLYGTGNNHFEGSFHSAIPEADFDRRVWEDTRYLYNGLFTGTVNSDRLSDVFASSNIQNGYIACILVPFSDEDVQRQIAENREMITYLSNYKSFQRVYGNASRRVEEMPLTNVVEAIEVLKEETELLLHNSTNGFVRIAVRFGANSSSDFRILASLISSCSNPDSDGHGMYQPTRFFTLPDVCHSWKDCLAVPYVEISEEGFYRKVYTLTVQDVKSVSSFCTPPINSYSGFYVKNYDVNDTVLEAFPTVRPIIQSGIRLGKQIGSGSDAVIPFSSIRSHVFVSGATETGKTTTVKKILTGLYSAGIPFFVIEAAKKEYYSLVGSVPECKVYTPGNDGSKLCLNPLQPEDGVLIENHVAAVVRSMIAATGGEHPIPEALEGLLKQTYHRYGWEYGTMAYSDSRKPFPTFKDVLDNVNSYIEQHAKYGPEVRQNLTAALTLRTENMYSGALGELFSKPTGLQARDLLKTPCVIELADLSPQSATFIMNILLFKLQSYLSRIQQSSELDRVIVIEEAHNIFRRTLSEENGRAINNEYFDKILSEIRSSGTGLIISDQRPSIMSEAVIANTSVKIIHSLTEKTDRQAIETPCGLSEFQEKKLGEFRPGECIASIRGYQGVMHISVEANEETTPLNPACHICTARFRCRRASVAKMLEEMDISMLSFYISKIQADPYNIPVLESNISKMLRVLNITASNPTRICLLGELLNTYSSSSVQEKRIIVNSYSHFLRRCDNG